MAEVEYAGKLPPFQIQSRGLGLRAAERDKELIVSNGKISVWTACGCPKILCPEARYRGGNA